MSFSKLTEELPNLLFTQANNAFSKIAEELPKILDTRTKTACAVLAAYVAICRGLRYRRMKQKHAQYPYKTREDYSKMTAEDAWEITKYVTSLEFPFFSEKALQFALFRYAPFSKCTIYQFFSSIKTSVHSTIISCYRSLQYRIVVFFLYQTFLVYHSCPT